MGASISLDSKYRLVLNAEVECISINPSSSSITGGAGGSSGGHHKKKHDHKRHHGESESDSDGSGSRSGGESDGSRSGSGSGSDSGSDSDSDGDKTYTVKLTPEIIGYIRSYIRKTQFLDEFDLITEIELDKYEHAPGSALVFNSDSIVFMTNNHTLEAVGDWEYIEPEKPIVSSTKSKSKGGSGSGSGRGRDRDRDRRRDDDDDDDDDDNNYERKQSNYKTKEDDLPVNEIESILSEKFEEYNKTREFVIHESKNSFLVLLIKSVEIVKA